MERFNFDQNIVEDEKLRLDIKLLNPKLSIKSADIY